MSAGGNRGVLERARALRHEGRHFALALVTDSEGSTYRKPGALAVVAEDGQRQGTLSGGCLEPALEQLAQRAMASGRAEAAVFDTLGDDDLLFGSGSGCRGRMRVLAWPVPADAPQALLDLLLAAQAAGHDVELAVSVDAARPGDAWAWSDGQHARLGTSIPDAAASWPHGLHENAGHPLARLRIRAAPRLMLIGGGPEAPPLLRLAATLGWAATVADHREGLLDPQRLADADRRLHARAAAALAEGPAPDAVLVMTHQASADLEALRALATMPVPYVGLLGPPARRDELLALLEPAGRDALRARLRAPVGLPLGGEGPEAIALAIAADLQRFFHAPG
ncbi:XdhC family protein [Arenimonas terrae]|uniref:XdhC family protein n=1 Tax=Arenimonas terrae TaxID=2546226 RepID=A0A5C4RRX4_9GAMM|nr:XdhC family protein [Arenimonas terrae]TNJ33950.1 XdhC family protein [Arenimonas terrae]